MDATIKQEKKSNDKLMPKIKLILKSVREYKWYAVASPFAMILEALMECVIPFHMSMFINRLQDMQNSVEGFSMTPLWPLIISLIVMACLSLTGGILGGVLACTASAGLAKNLRSDLYKKIQSFSFGNIDKFHASSLITRLTTDIQNVQQSFQMSIRIVFRAPMVLIFAAVMAFITGGNVAWIFVVLLPIVALGFLIIVKVGLKTFKLIFKRYDALNESVQENINGIRVVKSFVREDYEREKFNTASNNLAKDFIKVEKITALSNPIMNTSIHLSNIVVVGLCSYLIFKNIPVSISGKTLGVGDMSALLTYGIQILSSLMMVAMILVMFSMSLEGIRRVGEVLQEETLIKNPDNPIMELEDGSIKFNNVNFKYKESAKKNTLSDINIDIKSGQFVGIIGSTGSGKTTITNLISRLYDVSSGEVIVGGHNVKEYDLVTLRDNVAVVLQKNVLFSGTIATNLRWGDINASDEELVRACQIAQADEFIQSFKDKYDTRIEQGGTNVSGGQKQRLCIARAILKKPKILILDDSTSAVDTKTDLLIRKGLKEDIPETTKIVIAQRISSIEDADQIIVLDDGKINDIGNHEQLLKRNKIYQEVYYTQNRKGGNE